MVGKLMTCLATQGDLTELQLIRKFLVAVTYLKGSSMKNTWATQCRQGNNLQRPLCAQKARVSDIPTETSV